MLRAAALLFVLPCVACASMSGRFRDDGFHDAVYGYRVRYAEPGSRSLLGPDWLLDNLVLDDRGPPVEDKTAPEYRTMRVIDVDADGDPEEESETALYDLRFVHRRDAGVIWLRTLPISARLADTDLRVIAHRYVEEVSGGTYFAVSLAGEPAVADVRLATTIVQEGETDVSGRLAYWVMFDVANVDQLRLDAANRTARVLVALVRPGYYYVPGFTGVALPALMVIGYANAPEYFDAHSTEFAEFIRRIDLQVASQP